MLLIITVIVYYRYKIRWHCAHRFCLTLVAQASRQHRELTSRRELSRWRNIACLYNAVHLHIVKRGRLCWSKCNGSSCLGERTRCPSYFSRDFSRASERERERYQNSSLFLLFSLVFPLLPLVGLHFLRREWENRLNISGALPHPVVAILSTYLSPLVSYFFSLLLGKTAIYFNGNNNRHHSTVLYRKQPFNKRSLFRRDRIKFLFVRKFCSWNIKICVYVYR